MSAPFPEFLEKLVFLFSTALDQVHFLQPYFKLELLSYGDIRLIKPFFKLMNNALLNVSKSNFSMFLIRFIDFRSMIGA